MKDKLYKKVGKRYEEVTPQRFNIDFFEFSFLVTACIPPRPIARTMFWQKVVDKYYNVLTQTERDNLFEWVNREYSMEKGLEDGNEDCLLFNARYDKDNQYAVSTLYLGEESVINCFLWQNKYHTTTSQSIVEDYITKIEKLWETFR